MIADASESHHLLSQLEVGERIAATPYGFTVHCLVDVTRYAETQG